MSDAEHRFSSFTDICRGFLSEKTCEKIKSLLTSAVKHRVNFEKCKRIKIQFWKNAKYAGRAGYQKCNMEHHYKSLISRGKQEISENLAKNIKRIGKAAASLAFLSSFGSSEERNQAEKELDDCFELIHGNVTIIDMKFIKDKARLISKTPQVVSRMEMENKGDVAQTMKFTFMATKGKTVSTKHTVNFNYKIGSNFSAGFPGVGEISCQLSFDFSHNPCFQECINKTITKSYEFDLVVPAHCTQVARATVEEAEMEVPYELVFDFQGTTRSVEGLWKGVGCSEATYSIHEKDETDASVPEPYGPNPEPNGPEPEPGEREPPLFFVVIICLFFILFYFYYHF